MIEIDDVTVAVRGRTILDRCSATFRADTPTHLVGANGSGKTTLIRAIAGIQRYSGNICFDGADVARVRSELYVCFDDAPLLPYLSGYDNAQMLLGRAFSRTALLGVAPSIVDENLLRMRARKLSSGQRKRIHLLAALASGARYLVFDEALNGVDSATVDQFSLALAGVAPGTTVLFTGHHDETYDEPNVRRVDIIDGRLVSTDDMADGITA